MKCVDAVFSIEGEKKRIQYTIKMLSNINSSMFE